MLIGFKGDGTIVASDHQTVLGTYATETWYHVTIGYEPLGTDLTLDYWIDGDFLSSLGLAVTPSFEQSLDHINLTALEPPIRLGPLLDMAQNHRTPNGIRGSRRFEKVSDRVEGSLRERRARQSFEALIAGLEASAVIDIGTEASAAPLAAGRN